MSIGTNIYTLRKAKKITQAQLAQKLGVSEQAVSKWENEQCAPDISLFPTIADYFGISIDRIFGYHMNSYTEEVKSIIKAANDSGDTVKEIEICREGLSRFPNSPDLKISLAFSLSMINRISQDEQERQEAVNEAIGFCQEVVDTCGDIQQIDQALNLLARIYGEIGEHQKAMAAIEKISGENYFFRVTGIARTLGYEHNGKEMISYIEKNLFDCWLAMNQNLAVLTSRLSELGKHTQNTDLLKEIENLCSSVVAECKDEDTRYVAIIVLINIYGDTKQVEKAMQAVNLLTPMKYCREFAKSFGIGDGNTELYIQDEIDKLTDALGTAISNYPLHDKLPNDPSTWDRKIEMLTISNQLYRMIYGDNLMSHHNRLSRNYWLISTYQMAQGKHEEALVSLEKMCYHAVEHDKSYISNHGKFYTSILTDKLVYPEPSKDFHELEHADSYYMLDRLQSSRYDCIREDARFVAIVERLNEYAK